MILLDIRNIVLIEALAVDFSAGLSVLTGETGAGKSILLDALGLVLGGRADAGLVRNGADGARVTAEFCIGADHPARALLAANEIDGEAGAPLIVRRQLKADGGSRAFVNDAPVSAALLKELGATLVEIHGADTEDMRAAIELIAVHVDLADHRPCPIGDDVRAALTAFDAQAGG